MASWPLRLYRVSGDSMLPTYRAGDILIGSSWLRPRVERVVVAHTDRPLIKRVTQVSDQGYWIEGDNAAASTDSRYFGWFQRSQIEAVIISRLWFR